MHTKCVDGAGLQGTGRLIEGTYTMTEGNMPLIAYDIHVRSRRRRSRALAGRLAATAISATLVASGIAALVPAAVSAQTTTLTLSTTITNDDGGSATVGDFAITTDAGALSWDGGTVVAEGTIYWADPIDVSPATYSLSENDLADYTKQNWLCSANAGATWDNVGTFDSGSIAIAAGENVRCHIYNNDIAYTTTLTLSTTITNDDGGSATVGDFAITTDAGALSWDGGTVVAEGTIYWADPIDVLPDTYSLSENDLTDYNEQSWWCSSNAGATWDNVGTFDSGSIAIAALENVRCHIYNNDIGGTDPVIVIDPASLTYGTQVLGTTSSPQTVTITNDGASALTLGTAAITGTNPANFDIDTDACSGQTLAPAGTCDIAVEFTPNALGARNANLRILSDSSSSPDLVPLSGTGVAPGVATDPTSLAFGNQALGTTSSPQTVTVTNDGTASLTIGSVGFAGSHPGDYGIDSDTCSGQTIAPAGTCDIAVEFSPTATSGRPAVLSIPSDAASSPDLVPLTGTGIEPGVDLEPSSLAFGNQLVGTIASRETVTVTNDGSTRLDIGSVSLAGAHPGDYDIDSDTCSGRALAPTATCSVGVEFSPTAAGSRPAVLSIPSNTPTSPDTVSLTGTGLIAVTKTIDDKSGGFTKFKSGWKKQGVGWNGRSFWTPVRKGSAYRSAQWKTGLNAPGRYEVWVRYPKQRATTKNAVYRIYTEDGLVLRKRSQKYTAGKWVRLGAFDFGNTARVKLNDKTGERTSTGRRIVFDVVRFVPVSPSVAAEPIVVEPAIVEAPAATDAVRLRLYPKTVTAVTGARKVVTAWTCPADDRSPFGPDRTPGTRDDDCDPVKADWELKDPTTARLSRGSGHAVRVQLSEETDNRLVATWEDQRQGVKLIAKPRPKGTVAPPPLGEYEAPALALRPYPKTVSAVPGARKLVSAWTCPAADRSPFGPDRTPGTRDDACDPVSAEWSLKDEEHARLNERTGHAVLVQLADETDNRLIVEYEDLRQGVKLTAKPRPAGTTAPPLFEAWVEEE